MSCRCQHLGATSAAAVTVTAFPCGDVWALAQKNPSMVNRAHYQLCLATNKAGQLILDAGHWVWSKLKSLWGVFRGAVNAIAGVVSRIAQGAFDALKWLLGELKALLQWLDDQAKHVLDWFIWVGLAVGGVLLAHDYFSATRVSVTPPAPAKAAT